VSHVEVQQQTELPSGQLQVAQQLGGVDRHKPLNRLDLDDYFVIHQQVQPEPRVELDAVVGNGTRHLPRNAESRFRQFMGEADFVNASQHPGPEGRVDLHRGVHDPARNSILDRYLGHLFVSLASFASLALSASRLLRST